MMQLALSSSDFVLRHSLFAAILCLASPTFAARSHTASTCDAKSRIAPDGKPYWHIDASEGSGFSFPYVLYIPVGALETPFPYLLVEPNNIGAATTDPQKLDDDAVRGVTSHSPGNTLAERLNSPFLIPEFPRPSEGHSDIYTHSLSRETMLIPSGALHRIDIQLIAMATDAQRRLTACGIVVNHKIVLDGFSASAMFVSRFVYLHPDFVAAAEFGGVNSFIMLPKADIEGHTLNYPLGLADYTTFTGHSFQPLVYNAVPQYAFMGANDTNDAASEGGDAYSTDDVALIHTLFGSRMLPDRWKAVQRAYRSSGASIKFVTYTRIGHGVDQRIFDDLTQFFEQVRRRAR